MRLFSLTVLIAVVSGCSGGGVTPAPDSVAPAANSLSVSAAPAPAPALALAPQSFEVYTLSNQIDSNRVLRFEQGPGGTLVAAGSFDTKGKGDPTIAAAVQGGIALDRTKSLLFAVSAGSNEISSFQIRGDGLRFISKVPSGGTQPVSLSVHGDILYVLNDGSSSISGFRIGAGGELDAIAGSRRPLSQSGAVGGAEVSFDNSGSFLIVTEKNTNRIDTYRVDDGIAQGPTVHSSAGKTPFGFAFVPGRDEFVVSEAFGGAAGMGAASSYDLDSQSRLRPVTRSLRDGGTAPCWFVITPADFAFTSNTGSASISAYRVVDDGTLHLLSSTPSGNGPADLALSPDNQFLYVVNTKSNTIGAYRIGAGGALSAKPGARGIPTGATGLAVFAENED